MSNCLHCSIESLKLMLLLIVMVLPFSLSFISKVRLTASTKATNLNNRILTSLFSSYNKFTHEENGLDILCLDFDGVLCASSEESSYSAIVGAMQFWPSLFQRIEGENFAEIQKSIQYLRPVIETGYENMLMARFLYENRDANLKEMEKQWTPAFRDNLIETYLTNKVN